MQFAYKIRIRRAGGAFFHPAARQAGGFECRCRNRISGIALDTASG